MEINSVVLARGSHSNADAGMCIMEAVSYFADEPFSDRPRCASSVLTAFGIRLNDSLPDDLRQLLVPLIPQIVGTRGDGLDIKRAYMAVSWSVRVCAPAWLELAGLAEEAASLRSLLPVDGPESARAARIGAQAARKAASEKRSQNWERFYAAADGAAVAAAAAAADADAVAAVAVAAAVAAVAVAAAGAAVAAVAAAAAAAAAGRYAAIYKAGMDRIAPTLLEMRMSAIELFGAMIAPSA